MKNKKIIRLFTAALAVALCATAFAVPAFAGGGDGEPYYTKRPDRGRSHVGCRVPGGHCDR